MNSISLKPGREASVYRHHHWIFSGALAQDVLHIPDGSLIKILSSKNETLGYGHYNSANISIRVLQFGGSDWNPLFWEHKIFQAYSLRARLGLIANEYTIVYRLIHGEGDELPGLIIDIYGDHAVIQCHTSGMYQHLDHIAAALIKCYGPKLQTIYNKSKESLGELSPTKNHFLLGNTEETIVKENGHQFKVNWVTGQKTGFFIDQRDNRKLLGEYTKGKSVLNLFSYSGGFSVYALQNGATVVDSVDVSSKAIELTDANIALLSNQDNQHSSYAKDVNSFLQSADQYDIIVCDPPAFAKSLNKRHQALNGYKNLNAKVIKKVKSGGLLFTFSCSQVMNRELFQQTILSAAFESNRKVKIIHHLSQAADHPINIYHPEGSYLKGLVLYIED